MTWEYIAGLFDGEGSMQLFARGFSKDGIPWIKARASIVQSNKRNGFLALLKVKDFLTANGIACNFRVNNTPHNLSNTPMGNLEISGIKAVKTFAEKVIPYSLIRHNDLQDALRFFVMYPSRIRSSSPSSPR